MMKDVFLIDANSIITPYHSYYPFDLADGFWSQLGHYIENGRIVILDLVLAEILKGNDKLTDWIRSLNINNPLDHRELSTITYYGQILQHIQSSQLYKTDALKEWSRNDIADPWLVAAAKSHEYCIVTLEVPNSNPDPKNPWKNAKIPDIAKEFGVKTTNLFSMMRALEFKL